MVIAVRRQGTVTGGLVMATALWAMATALRVMATVGAHQAMATVGPGKSQNAPTLWI
jgi:hypothetical protein